jgi:hypothetical protein
MSDLYEDEPLTLRGLIQRLADDDTLFDQPVHVDIPDRDGTYLDCLITGLTVRDGRQELVYERNRDGR